MQDIAQTLERNAREVRYGVVSVELRIHEGKVVRAVYTTTTSKIERNRSLENQMEVPHG